jgi:glycosyltransferase involved in cell wall biosynthesis
VRGPAEPKPVSIIIPTKNAATFLENCLKSIARQTYGPLEVLVIDSGSTDNTRAIAERYGARVCAYAPPVTAGKFDAPHKRNFGAAQASGRFVYYIDADMELGRDVVSEAVSLCDAGCDAVIVPEDSFGVGLWARAKNLERRCYWGDNTVEAPRFVKKDIWNRLGGLDETVGGNDDWDLYQKILECGYKVGRTRSIVRHNEGHLELRKLFRKRFMYGRDAMKYVSKRPKAAVTSYFPIRKAYLKHWRLFLARPIDTLAFVVMRMTEYCGGLSGIVYALLMDNKVPSR